MDLYLESGQVRLLQTISTESFQGLQLVVNLHFRRLRAANDPSAAVYVPFYFGGTSLLIVVGVALDLVAQIESTSSAETMKVLPEPTVLVCAGVETVVRLKLFLGVKKSLHYSTKRVN